MEDRVNHLQKLNDVFKTSQGNNNMAFVIAGTGIKNNVTTTIF